MTVMLSDTRRDAALHRSWNDLDYGIPNPFCRAQRIRIPKGTIVHTMEPGVTYKVAQRSYSVVLHHLSDGRVDVWGHAERGRGFVILPTVTWPGSGGYWQTVRVTPEFAEANGLTLRDLSETAIPEEVLDAFPAYGDGYDDRYTARQLG